jgi:hypothetical protein
VVYLNPYVELFQKRDQVIQLMLSDEMGILATPYSALDIAHE